MNMISVAGPSPASNSAIIAAIITGCVALVVAILGALAAYFAAKRQQRRAIYSEAVKAATAWTELLYRVRRRRAKQAPAIIELFHQAQENLNYYQAWVGAESPYMARSYRRLVRAVKEEAEAAIQQAWKEDIRPIPGDALPGDHHPNIEASVGAFLQDVRGHLSPLLWRKWGVKKRNPKDS